MSNHLKRLGRDLRGAFKTERIEIGNEPIEVRTRLIIGPVDGDNVALLLLMGEKEIGEEGGVGL